jgi:2,5-furandicarboxylate decarboxylase 1
LAGEGPPTENHILKQLSCEASFLKRMREQFPTLEKIAVQCAADVQYAL